MASLTPYSQAGGVWKGEKVKGYAEWMQSKHKIKKDEYVQLLKTFNPSKFDADLLVRTAKQAGMKYLVITAQPSPRRLTPPKSKFLSKKSIGLLPESRLARVPDRLRARTVKGHLAEAFQLAPVATVE